MARVTIRIFTHPRSVFEQHSFLVGNEQGGLTEQIGVVPIDLNHTTLTMLRQLIEATNDRGMLRRTVLYQELLSVSNSLPNPYGYSGVEKAHYRFGIMANPDEMVPTLIPQDLEDELLVSKAYPSLVDFDVIIIPQSQIAPDGSLEGSTAGFSVSVGTIETVQTISASQDGAAPAAIEGAPSIGTPALPSSPIVHRKSPGS
mmetsp:Transcript_18266/g.38308  ORF Transcript_18266/g.38308 Transcript_18266/m.38308 type:complete len:201 (-) Transcript_18266:110-712(-)|eukprot:CAMPEP_0119544138 /NCGR_PEP_ID=MMETSP1344-20130328/54556_1 /TAXON_ID=236787 /ORGANISM="Florenciella parvula, Strain CCMP2471" /LENGTH=200 /DNA_ID=CAMNT_0007588593 /DNA_START=133 /DNA_END=735 /DNA_ORIENTATION=-